VLKGYFRMKKIRFLLFVPVLLLALLVGCTPEDAEPTPAPPFPTLPPDPAEQVGIPDPEATPTQPYALDPQLWLTPGVIQPDGVPMIVSFLAPDDVLVDARYFPAAFDQAPFAVFLHQYNHDNVEQWEAFGYWLNNRVPVDAPTGDALYQDPSWFPELADEFNMSVLTFPFRGCEMGGCQGAPQDHDGWISDAQGALAFGFEVPTIAPDLIVAIGTSIGADAAVEACQRIQADGFNCAGVLAISPGGYMGNDFSAGVAWLAEVGVPVWCYAAEGDSESAQTCEAAQGDGFEVILVAGSAHGIQLADPDIEPNLPEVIVQFLQAVLPEDMAPAGEQ
jgi:hypothetical protein